MRCLDRLKSVNICISVSGQLASDPNPHQPTAAPEEGGGYRDSRYPQPRGGYRSRYPSLEDGGYPSYPQGK